MIFRLPLSTLLYTVFKSTTFYSCLLLQHCVIHDECTISYFRGGFGQTRLSQVQAEENKGKENSYLR